jgi:Family of unknown function (DUF6325)
MLTVAEAQTLGPISYLIVEFPGNKMTGEGFAVLLDLVDRGLVRVLDLRFITKAADASVRAVELADLDHAAPSWWRPATFPKTPWWRQWTPPGPRLPDRPGT